MLSLTCLLGADGNSRWAGSAPLKGTPGPLQNSDAISLSKSSASPLCVSWRTMHAAQYERPPGCRRRRGSGLVDHPDSANNTPAGEHTPLPGQATAAPAGQCSSSGVPAMQNLKRSGDLKKGVWILAAGVLTVKCLMAGFRSLVRILSAAGLATTPCCRCKSLPYTAEAWFI